jgi:hypothetical protein
MNDNGKVTKGSVNDRLKALKDEADGEAEEAVLKRCLELMDAEDPIARVRGEVGRQGSWRLRIYKKCKGHAKTS